MSNFHDRVPEYLSVPRHSQSPFRRVYCRDTRKPANTEQRFIPSRNLIEDNGMNIRSDMSDFQDRVPEYRLEPWRSRSPFQRVSFREMRREENSDQRFSVNVLNTPPRNPNCGYGINIRSDFSDTSGCVPDFLTEIKRQRK